MYGQPQPPPGPSQGNAGGSNYTTPPPPPPAAGQQHEGGFGDTGHRRKMWRNALLALLAVGVVLWLLIWVLPPRMVGLVPTDVDVAIGEASWEDVAPPASYCTDPGPLAYVEELAQPLVAEADSEFEFHFVVVDSEEINAFALPGGFVTVNMGLLEAAETGEEVAAVLAHEMTHVTHRHGMRAIMRRVGGLAVVSLVFGGTGLETLAYGAAGLVNQAHSRDQERDADDGGRELLMAAGIDPTGMATFFERLEEEYEAMPESMRKGFALLSTHPDPGERASTTRELAAGFTTTRDLPDPPEDLHCYVE
jgi:predicted Zn-dependent protease